MDRNIKFERVEYAGEGGETVVKEYHAPFVPDDEFDEYEPLLFNVNPARKYGAAGIVGLEIIVMGFVAWKLLRVMSGVLGGGGKEKRAKQD